MKNRSKSILLLILMMLVTYLIYLNYYNSNELYYNDIKLSSMINSLDKREKYEGQQICNYFNGSVLEYLALLEENELFDNILLISIDSINCYSCFNYHLENVNELDIPKVIYSKKYSDLIISKLSYEDQSKFILQTNSLVINEGIFISLINSEGKIIYVDIADKTNYRKSDTFYRVVKNYLKLDEKNKYL